MYSVYNVYKYIGGVVGGTVRCVVDVCGGRLIIPRPLMRWCPRDLDHETAWVLRVIYHVSADGGVVNGGGDIHGRFGEICGEFRVLRGVVRGNQWICGGYNC